MPGGTSSGTEEEKPFGTNSAPSSRRRVSSGTHGAEERGHKLTTYMLDTNPPLYSLLQFSSLLFSFLDSAEALVKEVGSFIVKFEVCDNIDLSAILQVCHFLLA